MLASKSGLKIRQLTKEYTMTRKAGQAMSNKELQAVPANKLIDRVQTFVRVDFGGQELKERIALGRALEHAPEISSVLEKLGAEEQKALGDAIVKVAQHAAEGSRKRLQTTVDEMRRRWGTPTPPKSSGTKNPVIKI
jgi:hypothetical protein